MVPKKEHDLNFSDTYWSSEDEVEDEKIDSEVVIDRYGNFHLTDTDTDTDMLIITYTDTDTDTDMKKTNSPIPIPIPIRRITNSPIPMPIPI